MEIFRKSKFRIFVILIFVFPIAIRLTGQNLDFKCGMIEGKNEVRKQCPFVNWSNDSINNIYNSLSITDFSKVDFEFRIWNNSAGQLGQIYRVFIMRHYIANRNWKAFYFKLDYMEKVYFSYTEMKNYNSKDIEEIWNKLVKNGILLLSNPSSESLSEIPSYSIMDCTDSYELELVNKIVFKMQF